MNTVEINRLLRARCRNMFLGVFSSDRLPKTLPPRRPLMMVCNTDPHNRPGEHWVVLYIGKNGVGEYFDSLKQQPPRVFKNYLNKWTSNFKTNSRQLQSAASHFCGQYSVFYCLFRSLGYSLHAIDSCFTDDQGANDVMVHALICRMSRN